METTKATGRIIRPAHLALANLAWRDETRPNLHGVYLSPTHAVATDGACMGIVDVAPESATLPEAPALIPCILEADDAKRIAKAIPGKANDELRQFVVDVEKTNSNGRLHGHTLDDRFQEMPQVAGKVDGAGFPDWRQVVPSAEPTAVFAMDAALLVKVLQTAIKCHGKGTKAVVKVEVYGEGMPVKITGRTEDGDAMTFVVMPCRM